MVIGEALDIGIGEYRISPGAHICGFYSASAERDALLSSYVRSALRSGDKCICVLDPPEAAQMRRIVTGVGDDGDIDLEACSATRQLELVDASESTVPGGQFCAAEKIGFWKVAIAGIMNTAHFSCVRAIGEISSYLREVPAAREVIEFERELNGILPLYPQVMLCLYNLDYVGGALLVDLVSTHPKVLVNNMLVENPYYLSPEDWFKGLGA